MASGAQGQECLVWHVLGQKDQWMDVQPSLEISARSLFEFVGWRFGIGCGSLCLSINLTAVYFMCKHERLNRHRRIHTLGL